LHLLASRSYENDTTHTACGFGLVAFGALLLWLTLGWLLDAITLPVWLAEYVRHLIMTPVVRWDPVHPPDTLSRGYPMRAD